MWISKQTLINMYFLNIKCVVENEVDEMILSTVPSHGNLLTFVFAILLCNIKLSTVSEIIVKIL